MKMQPQQVVNTGQIFKRIVDPEADVTEYDYETVPYKFSFRNVMLIRYLKVKHLCMSII